MPDKSALATMKLLTPSATKTILRVWSRTYDDPDPARRCALVTGVEVKSPGGSLALSRIEDRAGIDHTAFMQSANPDNGYVEYDTGGACGAGNPNVFWGAYSGIYDERCIVDVACDARRLRSYRPTQKQVVVYNYVLGPVDFIFNGAPGAKTTVRITVSQVGGNGGNPAVLSNTTPPERFTVQL